MDVAALPLGEPGIPCNVVDPTVDELAAIDTVDAACAWAGITADLRQALELSVGGPITMLRHLLLIDRTNWDFCVSNTYRGDGQGAPLEVNGEPVWVGALAAGRLESLRRIARLKAGLCPGDHPDAVRQLQQREQAIAAAAQPPLVPPTGPAQGGGATPTTASSSGGRRIKLSTILDPTCDAEVIPMDPARLKQLHRDYIKARGASPKHDIEPTDDQVSALFQVTSEGHPPYADFSIFGKFGKRMLAKLQFTAWTLLPDGAWVRKELPGPPDLSAWWNSWRVLRTALLLLQQVSPEVLDQYGDLIRDLSEQYGADCWYLVYLADVRMRSEEFPRLRRSEELRHEERLLANLPSAFNPDKPWDRVFSAATEASDFWREEVKEKSVLHKCRVKTQSELVDDGTVQPGLAPAASTGVLPRAGQQQAPPPRPAPPAREDEPPAKKARTERAELPPMVNGKFEKNRAGEWLCQQYAEGKCSRGSSCRYAHQCPLCLKTHNLEQHHKEKNGGGKGGGKGGGSKKRGGRGGRR